MPVRRDSANPLITPDKVSASNPAYRVRGVFNPGATMVPGTAGASDGVVLVLRVSEDVPADDGRVAVPIMRLDDGVGVPDVIEVGVEDAGVELRDTRGVVIDGREYLSTMSHLRLARSTDGVHFTVDDEPFLFPSTEVERFGVEDARVTQIDDRFLVNYTAVSGDGWATALASTTDFQSVERLGLIFHPQNKDVAIFPEKVGGRYVALHRPNNAMGRASIWYAESPDLVHWGNHRCLLRPRDTEWEEQKIGGGAPPIRTADGWLTIYHGKGREQGYSLWALLLDADDPSVILAQGSMPLLTPEAPYEREGFFGGVVFTNGMVQRDGELLVYYGAADECVALARTTVPDVLASLQAP